MKLVTESPPSGNGLHEALGAGTYTDIIEIVAPSQAAQDSRVDVTVKIKNKWTTSVHIYCVAVVDSVRFIDWLDAWVSPGVTKEFSGAFIMGGANVRILAQSWYEAPDGLLYRDDERTKDVKLEVVAWQKLATQAVTVTPIQMWQKLAEQKITITPTEVWQKLAYQNITITPIPVEAWQKLAAEDVTITPAEVPPEYKLLEETIYPYAYIYEGPHDGGVFTFTTDPFTPTSWIAGKLAAAAEDEVRKSGGKMLEMRVYVDKSPLLWSNWRIDVVAVPPESTGVGMPLGVAWWIPPLLYALVAALLIYLTYKLIKELKGIFKRKVGLDDVKVGWEKNTLIMTIQDSEEYWERTPTPIETLEGMSEEELRHYLNQIAGEEVPPVEPGVGLAIAAIGVLGLGALAVGAMAMGRTEGGRR